MQNRQNEISTEESLITSIDRALLSLTKKDNGFYIWRTRGDGKVRSEHAANDGKIFSFEAPPETGNPGDDYGCKCIAEPYIPEISEYMNQTLISGVSDSSPK